MNRTAYLPAVARLANLALAALVIVGLLPGQPAPVAAQGSGLFRFVAPNGSDASNCETAKTPCRSIDLAINRSIPGGTIFIAPGTYAENLTLGKNLTLAGASPATTFIGSATFTNTVMTIPANVTANIANVTIRHGAASGSSAGSRGLRNEGNLTLRNVVVSNNRAPFDRSFGDPFGSAISNTKLRSTVQV